MERKITNIKERILQITDFKGIAKEHFFEQIGMTYGSFKGKQKETSLNSDAIDKILSIYSDIDANWLLTGKGDMLKSNSILKADLKPETEHKPIPLVPVNAVAGFGSGEFTVMEYDIIQYYNVPEFKNADFLIPVTGSSMQPKYFGGDMLACRIIHSMSYFEYGFPHVITIKDRGTVVKRVFQGSEKNILELRSDNPDYPPYEIPIEDIVNISIVIGVIRLE